MYTRENLKHLALAMEHRLSGPFEKLIGKQIDNNEWMKKLIAFYEEEVGSDEDGSSDANSESDKSSASEGAATSQLS